VFDVLTREILDYVACFGFQESGLCFFNEALFQRRVDCEVLDKISAAHLDGFHASDKHQDDVVNKSTWVGLIELISNEQVKQVFFITTAVAVGFA
jgi:hypothetical protein